MSGTLYGSRRPAQRGRTFVRPHRAHKQDPGFWPVWSALTLLIAVDTILAILIACIWK